MPIDHINLARVDLNLLVALDALLAERSVTKAAARIGIGQSAMSHNLARLRDLFGDELLTRGPKGMQPTPRALALADPVRIALAQIETLVSRDETFNPATAERVFRIGLPDSVEVLVGPALLTYVCAHAPGIRFRFYAAEGQGLLDHLDADRLDLGIGVGAFAGGQAHHKRRVLATDSYLVMFNAQKIDIETPISLEDYVRVPHVLTSLRLGERGVVDEVLEQMGLKRHVALVTPRFVAVPFLVAGSPVLTTMHARLAIYFADQLGLSLSPPPIELPKLTTSLLWHASYDRDPAHVWLRETIMRVSVEERAKLRAAGRLDI
ncbi:LysR family transcriptional regulator [Hyphomicrobium sulfonivorans]|uniref:LysR family transcriptional regulator n=1 Tax=Hyphomicrobium sulfonivorans TaxID=121290 RepID=UPI00156DFB43|nr:LysR family transcriptional regulator [Hyphomicrobium sulfonivorans]MBI1648375.1 LysR family transcriptional regulator [Hyphomicrobium sulfonivorans]NSL71089.1 LysR family transcriptional regulator [Hyphomicrobium sulfonivorans]